MICTMGAYDSNIAASSALFVIPRAMTLPLRPALLLAVVLSAALPCLAQAADTRRKTPPTRTYTAEALRDMLEAGRPPRLGKPQTQTQRASFPACAQQLRSLVDSAKPSYPVRVLTNTQYAYRVRIWTSNALMTMSCSRMSGRSVITIAPYLR